MWFHTHGPTAEARDSPIGEPEVPHARSAR